MPLQGPLVVVGQPQFAGLLDALGTAGAFPVIEATRSDAADVIAAASPESILLADDETSADRQVADILERLVAPAIPYVPVVACAGVNTDIAYARALPVEPAAAQSGIVARLSAAFRARSLHATVLRRLQLAAEGGKPSPEIPDSDPLEDSTVIVAGRGRSYPVLSTMIGERAGLIGALSVETAASYLKAREIDGLVIGDGFAARTVSAFLTVIAEDTRFRDLPVALLGNSLTEMRTDHPYVFHVGNPERLVERLLPFVRLHAFEQRLSRTLSSIDHDGRLDPKTGLLFPEAFVRELEAAITESRTRGTGLSLARFVFEPDLTARASFDAARLASRLIRGIDFGCREPDGSVLIAFTETDLRYAHVVARRIASVLKHTMLSPQDRKPTGPAITLATRKSTDDADSLLGRVTAAMLAAE
jgi:hypothetical protein